MKSRYFVLAGMLAFTLVLNMALPAFGDGFSMENLPPASLGNRKAGLFIQVNPPIITLASIKNASIFLKLYDANTNQTIQHVSYFIKVEKGGKMLMQDLFHTHTGELTLKIDPKQGPVNIYGDREPILNGWVESGGPIVVQGPIFLEGGLYHFTIEVFGVDYDNNIFKPEDAPKFDSWLSVGDITSNAVTYQQKNYTISTISYYDKISGFSFDQQKEQISYQMPFNWNVSRLQKYPVFVHEEMRVPRNFTALASGEFSGTVNDMQIPSDAILVDDSNPDYYVVHYMLKKDHLLRFANALQTSPNNQPRDTMVFTLSPKESVSMPSKQINVSVNIKQTKKLTLIAVKDNENVPIYGLQLKMKDGEIKFVKARGWDRHRIDQSTVVVSTQDNPLTPDVRLIVLLLSTNPSSSIEWSVLDKNGSLLGNGILGVK